MILILLLSNFRCILGVVIIMDEIMYPRTKTTWQASPASRRRIPREKGRDPYDGLRPWSALTHGLGALLAIPGAVLLLLRASSAGHRAAFAVYGGAMLLLYAASTLYHCVRTTPGGRIALRKLDHASIYLLIAGTYTPICLIALRGSWGWALLGVIWTLAVLGLVLTLLWIQAPRWVTAGICLFMGWLAVVAIFPLRRSIGWAGLFWLLLGGVLYTVGGVLYALKWPGRNNPRFGCHEIFHLFILLGSIAHYLLMYRVIALL